MQDQGKSVTDRPECSTRLQLKSTSSSYNLQHQEEDANFIGAVINVDYSEYTA